VSVAFAMAIPAPQNEQAGRVEVLVDTATEDVEDKEEESPVSRQISVLWHDVNDCYLSVKRNAAESRRRAQALSLDHPPDADAFLSSDTGYASRNDELRPTLLSRVGPETEHKAYPRGLYAQEKVKHDVWVEAPYKTLRAIISTLEEEDLEGAMSDSQDPVQEDGTVAVVPPPTAPPPRADALQKANEKAARNAQCESERHAWESQLKAHMWADFVAKLEESTEASDKCDRTTTTTTSESEAAQGCCRDLRMQTQVQTCGCFTILQQLIFPCRTVRGLR